MKVISNRNIHKPNICKKYSVFYFEIIIFLIKIALFNFVNKKYINYYSEIHLFIKGSREQKLLNTSFTPEPSEVYVNGIKTDSCKKICYLEGEQSNITLRFENQFTSCYKMFDSRTNIIEVDLSDFDASNLSKADLMFYNCESLNYLNMRSFKLDNSTTKISMFYSVPENVKFCT